MQQQVIEQAAPTREEFVARRISGIGGSDAATVCGLNPWKSAYELWLEKTRQIVPDDISDREYIIWGNKLEPVIAERYEEVSGHKTIVRSQLFRHPEHDWMIANIDRDTDDPLRMLECKTTNAFGVVNWGPTGTDQVPESYLLQCQHYLAVTGKQFCDLAVLIGGSDFRIYELRRDDELIEALIAREFAFWTMCKDMVAPPIDTKNPGAVDMLKRLYPGTNGVPVALPEEANDWHKELEKIKADKKELETSEKVLKANLLAAMGEAPVGILSDGGSYTRKVTERAGYVVNPCEYVDFRFKKAGK